MKLFSTAGLARSCARHPWIVISSWIVVLAMAFVAIGGLDAALTTEAGFSGNPEYQQGAELLHDRLRGERPLSETVIVHSDTLRYDDPAFVETVGRATTALNAMTGVVASTTNYYLAAAANEPGAEQLLSADGHSAIIPVTFTSSPGDKEERTDAYLAVIERQGGAEVSVYTVGDLSVDRAANELAKADLEKAEMISLPISILILAVVFGALVAVGIPVVLSIVSIILALGITAIVGRYTDLSFYVVNMITMIGLAVGIDYTLFIVFRYREERRRGHEQLDAIEIAGGTATRAVLFSGGTVILALMGMFLIPLDVFHSLGAGAVLAAVAAVAGTLTLVPALLGLLGDKIDWPRTRRYDAETIAAQNARDLETYQDNAWGKLTRAVMARPAIFICLSVGLLVACALPYLDLNRGSAGIETQPPSEVRTAYMLLEKNFSAGLIAPLEIVIDGDATAPAAQMSVQALIQQMAADPIFGPVTVSTNPEQDLTLLSTPLTVDSTSRAATDAVWHLRDELIPGAFGQRSSAVYVTGEPAYNADYYGIVDSATLPVFAFVLGFSFLLLLLAFRSIVVAAKAVVMNLLSVGAAYGLMVLVFQKGYLHSLFGFQQTPTIEAWVPIFLFCVLFGLSMDYHVFLLSRIREHFDRTGRNTESVAVGLQSTAKIITGAAGIMIVVFGGFATGDLVAFQQMGFGMTIAVLLDATVVRTILVPATMAVLGDRNWYLPRWLAWLPNLHIEGSSAPAQGPAPAQPLAPGFSPAD
jgi:putative drug exporter of the RND superfamily